MRNLTKTEIGAISGGGCESTAIVAGGVAGSVAGAAAAGAITGAAAGPVGVVVGIVVAIGVRAVLDNAVCDTDGTQS